MNLDETRMLIYFLIFCLRKLGVLEFASVVFLEFAHGNTVVVP